MCNVFSAALRVEEAYAPLLEHCSVVELNQIASFQNHFIDSMPLVPHILT